MFKTNITVSSEKEEKEIIKKLILTGYKKTSDCMWAKVFEKPNLMIIIERA